MNYKKVNLEEWSRGSLFQFYIDKIDVYKRQVFMVTAVFSMAEMGAKMEEARLMEKHGDLSLQALFESSMGQSLLLIAAILFLLILFAGVLMISGSINSSVAQRTKLFGMMRCIGMSKQQIIRCLLYTSRCV